MKKKRILFVLSAAILLLLLFAAGLCFGSVSLSPADILQALSGKDPSSVPYILLIQIRLPRVIGGIFAGMGLACAGVLLQNVMNNSLASPNTIGVNSGAGFAVLLCMLCFPGSVKPLPAAAFLGALLTAGMIFLLAYLGDNSRTTIILAGITVSSFLNAGINFIKILHTDLAIDLTGFLIGSLSSLTQTKILLPCCLIAGAVLIGQLLTTHMNILSLGDITARSLGLKVGLFRFILLALASVLAGCVVSYAGLLSFAGLIVPHICRRIFGNDARVLFPVCALTGACFVPACDLLGRVLAAPYELPTGIIMAFIGGPFFLYLLLKKKGGRRINA